MLHKEMIEDGNNEFFAGKKESQRLYKTSIYLIVIAPSQMRPLDRFYVLTKFDQSNPSIAKF
jgi:hypothetical protein